LSSSFLSLSSSFTPPPPTPTLFPYTTLFRSADRLGQVGLHPRLAQPLLVDRLVAGGHEDQARAGDRLVRANLPGERDVVGVVERSEEHTSELQSLAYLVCRLLLEKKKKKTHN